MSVDDFLELALLGLVVVFFILCGRLGYIIGKGAGYHPWRRR